MNIGAAATTPMNISARASNTSTRVNPVAARRISGTQDPGRAVPALDPHSARAVQVDAVVPVPALYRDQACAGGDAAVRGEGRLVQAAGDVRQGDRRTAVGTGEGDLRRDGDRVERDVVRRGGGIVEIDHAGPEAGGVDAELAV